MGTPCKYCDIEGVMYRYILGSGAVTVTERCPKCGISTGEKLFFPKKDFHDFEKLPLYKDNTIESEPCAVEGCDRKDTQLHHFAPFHLFGYEEAWLWPTAYLCMAHHLQWHKLTKTGMYMQREKVKA